MAPTASASCRASPSVRTGEYRLTITFACDPARTESLVQRAFQVIDEYKRTGPGQGQVVDTRRTLARDFETNSAENDYLLNRMLFKYEFGEDVQRGLQHAAVLRSGHGRGAA